MYNELTDLLPPERREALSREYYLRLGVVAVSFVTALVLISMVLLVPTYLFLTTSANAKETRLAAINATLTSSNEGSLTARLTALSSNAATLSALAQAPSASAAIRSILALSRPGITLSAFTYTPAGGKKNAVIAISGTAATRDALRNYQLALSGAPAVLSADLPVSAYAKDSDISFTITMTLAP